MKRTMFAACLAVLAICSCSKVDDGTSGSQGGGAVLDVEFVNRCNYESVRLEFHPNQLQYEIVTNPLTSGLNTTRKCAKVVSVGGDNEFLWCDPMPRKLDFTRNAPIFKMMVCAPKAGAAVTLKLEHPNDYTLKPLEDGATLLRLSKQATSSMV